MTIPTYKRLTMIATCGSTWNPLLLAAAPENPKACFCFSCLFSAFALKKY